MHAELLKLSFSYDDTPKKVKSILLDIATKNNKVLTTPAPAALTLSYDDFAITYGLVVFMKDYEDIIVLKDEIMSSIYLITEQKGLTIPYPRQEVEVKMSGEGKEGDPS